MTKYDKNTKLAKNEPKLDTYAVKPGDTIQILAKRFKTTWQAIYLKNKDVIGNNPNNLNVGIILQIEKD